MNGHTDMRAVVAGKKMPAEAGICCIIRRIPLLNTADSSQFRRLFQFKRAQIRRSAFIGNLDVAALVDHPAV
ncbi:hypothetical protein CTB91_01978 [Dickeya solani]|uniref:Uncharacterized protein n=1 Tax=Dickeya solani D s0432-1 TaxID=1231725 RepID=A0AAV3KDT9_9GAMM|nr:hypothetical protein CTB91_01978 [Dickeya solani]ERO58770.1 hypothetical protein A544_1949 [Dickeya solani D s0432-1]AYQ51957.1 hypothetical protein DSOL99_01983 [Dickeya solani]MBD3605323.1 hypothetical protein [Dickeya solani]NUA39959.1 hypothetical protein [Dickeya solani]